MAQKKPIGKVLEELGFITDEQINVTLAVQKASPKFFGEILQDLDFITSDEVAQAIALQNNLEYVDLETVVPSTEALKTIPQDVAKTRNILPISIDDNYIIVATQEFNDLMTKDYIHNLSRRQVKFVVGDNNSIARYTQIYYHQLSNPIETEIKNIVKRTLDGATPNLPHLVELILNNAIKDKATDIHVTPESSVSNIFYRIDGVLQHYYALPLEIHQQMVARIKIISNLDISEQRKPQDGSFSYKFLNDDFDLRISTLPTNHGENVVMRLLGKNSSLSNLSYLGFSEENSKKVENYFNKPYGIILIVGPTGSGKTTTLYSALRKINSLKKNVLTIEDPIEYKFSFIKQTQLNEKAGYDFNAAIRAFMRQDPDVMLVGEIRDAQTAELAVRASITGHLVLSTLHTNDAVGTIPRLGDLNIPAYLIGSGLLAVIAQRLVRKLCSICKAPINMNDEELTKIGVSQEIIDTYKDRHIHKAVGCQECHNTGYKGRQVITEILEIDEDLESMITENATTFDILQKAREKGMKLMKEDGYAKAFTGITTFDEVHRVVN